MRITIATPLFPPDVEEPAPYVKELARRLAANKHTVTVLMYGRLPESIERVRSLAIDKRTPRGLRMLNFSRALWQCVRTSDLLFVENGPSVELPLFVLSLLTPVKYIVHEGDPRAAARVNSQGGIRAWLARQVRKRAIAVLVDAPPARPEILPYTSYPKSAFETYEREWSKHLALLAPFLSYDNK